MTLTARSQVYNTIDGVILSVIKAGHAPLDNATVRHHANKLCKSLGRSEPMRVIDGRITALKKAGKIRFVRGKAAHWEVLS